MKSSHVKFVLLFALCSPITFFSDARSETESSIAFNLNYLSGAGTTNAKIANPGYAFQFTTGIGGPWLRSEFGATIERATGAGETLTAGSLFAGGGIAHKAGRLTPFMGVDGILGWGNYSGPATNNNGLLYGGMISAGAEFALKKSGANRFAVIFKTSYRMLSGSLGPLSGADLNAVALGLGLSWSDGGSDRGGGDGEF